jgi:hypothetical protein
MLFDGSKKGSSSRILSISYLYEPEIKPLCPFLPMQYANEKFSLVINLILQMILMELLLAAPGPSGVLVRGRALPVRGVQLYSVLTTFLCGVGFSQITTDIGTHTYTVATCNIETHACMHSRAKHN